MSDIETRLAALERSVRRWRLGACAAGVALAAAVAVGAQKQRAAPTVLEGNAIRITDLEGHEVFSLGADRGGGASMAMHVGNRGGLVLMGAGKDGPQIGMRNDSKQAVVRITARDTGGEIVLYDNDRTTFAAPPKR